MLQQPDQFQQHVYVRLPFTDKYLKDEKEAEKVRDELKEYFARPLLIKNIIPKHKHDLPDY